MTRVIAAVVTLGVMLISTAASAQIPMPANPQVNEAESLQLVKWVLSIK